MIDTLAAAYAECGDFNHAVEYQQKALDAMKAQGADADTLRQSEARLGLYRRSQPFRDRLDP
jgi:hypothetical protein